MIGNHKRKTSIDLETEKVKIERAFKKKFLRVIIEHKLSWKTHVHYLCGIISRSIGVPSKCRYIKYIKKNFTHSVLCTCFTIFQIVY